MTDSRHHKILSILVGVLSVLGYGVFVFAAQLPALTPPPPGGYAAGDSILEPGCAPTTVDCFQNIGSGWSLTGDTGTDGGTTNFIGTTDAADFVIKVNGVEIGRFGQSSNMEFGNYNDGMLIGPDGNGNTKVTASGIGAMAWGGSMGNYDYPYASGPLATAWGVATKATDYFATAWGDRTQAIAENATSFGTNTTASGTDATAWGEGTTASSGTATAFGQGTTASGMASTAFGNNTYARSFYETAFGSYNVDYTPVASMFSMNTADRLLSIGNGQGPFGIYSGFETYHNAYTLWKDGSFAYNDDNFQNDNPGTEQNMFYFNYGNHDGLGATQTKRAIRLGSAKNNEWDINDALVGDYSIAIGFADVMYGGPKASGEGSIVIGAGKSYAQATGTHAVSIGTAGLASGSSSFAFDGIASGDGSFSFGGNSSGFESAAFNATSSGEFSFAAGLGVEAFSSYEQSFGTYNTVYVPMVTSYTDRNPQDRLFTIGNGDGDPFDGTSMGVWDDTSDAFTILKNGITGIGYDNLETTTSSALLQVNGDILSSALLNCGVITTDANGLFTCSSGGGLIGSTAGVVSNPTAGVTSEAWLGHLAGTNSASKEKTVFIGEEAGNGATNANSSRFIGYQAGMNALNASQSTFMGEESGYGATNAIHSFFSGYRSGYAASSAEYSNFVGLYAGYGASGASASNFFGHAAGFNASAASNSFFAGTSAGNAATSATQSTFIGRNAGYQAVNASYSNFIGNEAGYQGTWASTANFFGYQAGYAANNTAGSNFLGSAAGKNATNAGNSNFLGTNAGLSASGAGSANFFGFGAGYTATNAQYSNFLGQSAGYLATNAYNSNFFGLNAGNGATNASNSIFIGENTGIGDTVNNTGSTSNFSIVIGSASSTGGFSNSIALGQNVSNTATNQFMIGSGLRPIDSTRINGSASTQCTITTGTGIACTSDERVKTNIADLASSTLDTLLQVRTVTYNWLENPSGKRQVGFLAQNLEQYFPDVVDTDKDGMKSVYYAQLTPIIVEAVRELNVKIEGIATVQSASFMNALRNWFGDAGNGISTMYAKVFRGDRIETNELCVGQVCVTSEQFLNLVQGSGSSGGQGQGQIPSPTPIPDANPGSGDSNSGGDTQGTGGDVVPDGGDTSPDNQPEQGGEESNQGTDPVPTE